MTGQQHFLLKFNNFSEHVVKALLNLRENDDLTDCTLSCDGKRIKCHKVLLSVCSSYFKETFKETPCKHPVIIFNGIDFINLQTLITFMYHGEVNISQEMLPKFLETAKLLQIEGLTDLNGEGGGEDYYPMEQNHNRHNRFSVSSSFTLQNTDGFFPSSYDPTADSINPILKSLSTLTSSSKGMKKPRLSQPGTTNGSNFANVNSLDSQVPLSTTTPPLPVLIGHNNKIVKTNGAKANSSSRSRPSTNGNVIKNGSTDSLLDISKSTNLMMTLNEQNNNPSSSSSNGDHSTLRIKKEKGEFLYEEEFPNIPATGIRGGRVTTDNNNVKISGVIPVPNFVKYNSNTTTTTTNATTLNNDSKGTKGESNTSVLQEALMGRKQSSTNNFQSNRHHHHNFLKSKDPPKLSQMNMNAGPPKLHQEVPLLLNSSSTFSALNQQQHLTCSTSKSTSRQSPPTRPNLTPNQNQNKNLSVTPRPSTMSKSCTVDSNNKSKIEEMPVDLEMKKKVDMCSPTNNETSTSSSSSSKGQNISRGKDNLDLARQDEFMSNLNLLRNQSTATPSNTVTPVSSTSSSLSSLHVQQQSKPRSIIGKHGSVDNLDSSSSRGISTPNFSVSHQLLKSAKATVRAKEKQQQGQTGTASAAVIKARSSKTRNTIGPSGTTSGGGPPRIRRVSSFSSVGSFSSMKSQSGHDDDMNLDLGFQTSSSIHNRNDTGGCGPYACNLCGKTYVHHRSLNDHKKFHTGATRCPICSKQFSKVANMRAHYANAHQNGQVV